ncbi:MAG: hypothetical protein L6Q54_05150 [Leptospiraceae bacterium]|nr:hypothetical protein [Leptospiraceae bacterium]MCK6380624.1 hypothetical protein [Leptospiraceae bacterium]
MKNLYVKSILFHFIFGFLPSLLLFLYGAYLLKDYIASGLVPSFIQVTTNSPKYFLSLSFLIIWIFFYIVLFSFKLLKINYKKEIFSIFILFVISIPVFISGPFFQPPSDPVFHSGLVWDFLNKNEFNYINRAIIIKSIFASLNYLTTPMEFVSKIRLVLALHIISSAMMILSTYISSRLFGLNLKWAIFSTILFIVFFGTSFFGFIGYYSLAPASVNFAFYWLISSLLFRSILIYKVNKNFFFSKFFLVSVIGISLTPIMYYSHRQEAGFFFFVYFLSIVVLLIKILYRSKLKPIIKIIILGFVFLILFFPNSIFLNSKNPIFVVKEFETYGEHTFDFYPWLFGNIFEKRAKETFGILGFIPIIVFLGVFFYNRIMKRILSEKEGMFYFEMLPGLLPFWIILLPLNLYIWIKGAHSGVFWRFAYTSFFWVSIGCIFQRMETKLNFSISKFWNRCFHS